MILKPDILLLNRYLLIEKIGKGGFAEVWKANDTYAENLEVAVKILSPQGGLSKTVIAQFIKEYTSTLKLTHPNLLKPMHYDIVEENPFIIMPLCRKGSLEDLVVSGTKLSEKELVNIMHQMASALAYLHKEGTIHNDVKPGNVLIKEDNHYLLSDFGISTQTRMTVIKNSIDRNRMDASKNAMSVSYAAPELFSDNPQPAVYTDIFSLGLTIYEIATGILPWMGQGGIALKNGADIPQLPANYSKPFGKLITRCLDKNPLNRLEAAEIAAATHFYLTHDYWNIPSTSGVVVTNKEVLEPFAPVQETSLPSFGQSSHIVEPIKVSKTNVWGIAIASVIALGLLWWGGKTFILDKDETLTTAQVDSNKSIAENNAIPQTAGKTSSTVTPNKNNTALSTHTTTNQTSANQTNTNQDVVPYKENNSSISATVKQPENTNSKGVTPSTSSQSKDVTTDKGIGFTPPPPQPPNDSKDKDKEIQAKNKYLSQNFDDIMNSARTKLRAPHQCTCNNCLAQNYFNKIQKTYQRLRDEEKKQTLSQYQQNVDKALRDNERELTYFQNFSINHICK